MKTGRRGFFSQLFAAGAAAKIASSQAEPVSAEPLEAVDRYFDPSLYQVSGFAPGKWAVGTYGACMEQFVVENPELFK